MAVLLALAFAACGGGDTPTGAKKNPWIETMVEDPSSLRQETHDGETVWVDEVDRIIYAEDCKVTRALAEVEGAKYGAQPRNEDGSGGAIGYTSICRS